ncbi:hypothetical protein LINPERHAP2_LOCUS15559 [Linum perenne]
MEPKIICEIKAMHRLQHHTNILLILEVSGDLFSKVV